MYVIYYMNLNVVTILRGISGSGKSTYIKNNLDASSVVCSADHFFIDSAGTYNFDPTKLGLAHSECKKKFKKALTFGAPSVVVDNTNTTIREMAYYVETAKAFGYQVNFVRLEVPVEVCAKRNAHGVPFDAVKRMSDRMQELPKDWGNEKLVSNI